tara:strand:+ start:879 stop:1301 length:423 start_codon:yes stop_codon:yes gene_type:complete
MKIEIQRTDWIEVVYNKIKASKKGDLLFKTTKMYSCNSTNNCEWYGMELVSSIYLSQYDVSTKETTERLLGYISTVLEQFINNVTPLFLDSVTSLSYTDSHAKDYIENVQKIKGWYDKGLFGEVVSNVPVGSPLPQANYL